MSKILSLFPRAEADRKANTAPMKHEHELDMAGLDKVAGSGGGLGVNPSLQAFKPASDRGEDPTALTDRELKMVAGGGGRGGMSGEF